MLEALLWGIAALLAACGLLAFLAAWRLRAYVNRELRRDHPEFTPKVSVILPCKGVDPGLDQNVRSLVEQDYPGFELLCVTAAADDPAREVLSAVKADYPDHPIRLLVAGIVPGRSQKLNNQLHALGQARPETEALVFVDSDVRAHATFLRDLLAPLAEDGVGATTGFRWYIPERGGFGSYLQATWNGGGLAAMADARLAYVWGGSMGILRSTFERAGVAERWEHALTDDFPLTNAVRDLGLDIRFVPRCLLGSHEDATLGEVVEWTNRQTIISRVYDPGLWGAIFAVHAVPAIGMLAAGAVLAARAWGLLESVSVWSAAAAFAVVPIETAAALVIWTTVRRLLPEVGGWGRALKHACLAPAAMILICCNSVHSLLTHDIRWRGVRYRLHSPCRTEVLTMPE